MSDFIGRMIGRGKYITREQLDAEYERVKLLDFSDRSSAAMSEQVKTLISTALAILGTQIPGVAEILHDAGGVEAVIAAGATLTGLIRGLWHLVDNLPTN